MKNPFVKIIIGVLFAAVLIFLGRDFIIQAAAAKVVRVATGLELTIGQFHSSVLASTVDIKDLKLYNPLTYSERIMFNLPEVYVAVEAGSLFSGKPHLKELRLDLAQLNIERNKDGKLNLYELKPQTSNANAAPSNQASGKSGAAPTIQIDVLRLRIEKVVYKDLSGALPVTQEFNINLDKTYNNITDVRALAPIIIGDVMANTALGSILHFNAVDLLKNFQASGVNIADLGLEKISGLGLDKTLSGLVSSDTAKKAQDALGEVGGQLGSLFGSITKKK